MFCAEKPVWVFAFYNQTESNKTELKRHVTRSVAKLFVMES